MEKKSNPEQIISVKKLPFFMTLSGCTLLRKLIFSDFMRAGEDWLEENPHEDTIFFIPAD